MDDDTDSIYSQLSNPTRWSRYDHKLKELSYYFTCGPGRVSEITPAHWGTLRRKNKWAIPKTTPIGFKAPSTHPEQRSASLRGDSATASPPGAEEADEDSADVLFVEEEPPKVTRYPFIMPKAGSKEMLQNSDDGSKNWPRTRMGYMMTANYMPPPPPTKRVRAARSRADDVADVRDRIKNAAHQLEDEGVDITHLKEVMAKHGHHDETPTPVVGEGRKSGSQLSMNTKLSTGSSVFSDVERREKRNVVKMKGMTTDDDVNVGDASVGSATRLAPISASPAGTASQDGSAGRPAIGGRNKMTPTEEREAMITALKAANAREALEKKKKKKARMRTVVSKLRDDIEQEREEQKRCRKEVHRIEKSLSKVQRKVDVELRREEAHKKQEMAHQLEKDVEKGYIPYCNQYKMKRILTEAAEDEAGKTNKKGGHY